jgi:hypothetical protein
MNTAILVLLLLFAFACIVSGAPAESGKSRYGRETCLAVLLQTLKAVFLLILELRHDGVWGNAGKSPGILNVDLDAEVKTAYPF